MRTKFVHEWESISSSYSIAFRSRTAHDDDDAAVGFPKILGQLILAKKQGLGVAVLFRMGKKLKHNIRLGFGYIAEDAILGNFLGSGLF